MNRLNGEPEQPQGSARVPEKVKRAVDRIAHWLHENDMLKHGWAIGPMCSIGFRQEWIVATEALRRVKAAYACPCPKASPCPTCADTLVLTYRLIDHNTPQAPGSDAPEPPLLPPDRAADPAG